ncbi:flagellar assembly protein A [Pontibacillus marinus]|uniref:RNA-binding protein KhpB N-terminal domain-containing protein n=1 Tax=Pontibacillus marinus BH030004 = DSM 16465 TaxID=1385511 RepID=A0A0A5GKU9_9BACI|nr:flagellar assembly protein A [Pontibacillus marinus]KGX91790.1 hypothetical protein N783_00650 [Pontibacillus marinus BH030004 = DSM 16465]
MQSIVSKGKTIEDAVNVGLNLLEASKKEVNIEILQKENKGFMGVGRKQAVVKLSINRLEENQTQPEKSSFKAEMDSFEEYIENLSPYLIENQKLNMNDSYPSTDMSPSNLEGKVWVKDNQLFVKNSPSHFSTITSCKGVKLIKNGEVVKEHTTIISEKDQFEIEIENQQQIKETTWNVSIDSSGLSARLHIEPGCIIKRNVQNMEPSEHIELCVEETVEVRNEIDYEEIMKKINALHVTYGINQSEIIKAMNTQEPGVFEIANGKKAESGKDGWIELKIDVNPRNGLVEDESGNVDFRESRSIPKLEKGQIVAIVHPPLPGTPGVTVTNEPIPAKPTYPIKLKLGNGMIEVDDKLVATESGRPFVERRGQLVSASIMPKYVHDDHVNLSSGNIRFHGDVDILGEVEENMLVEAKGDIYVYGSVNQAELNTTKSIVVKGNIASSDIAAGKNNMLIAELGHILGVLHGQLEKMIAVIKQLSQTSAFKSSDVSVSGLQPLIRILLERRFKGFLSLVNQYQTVVNKGEKYLDSEDWSFISVSLTQIFQTLSNQLITIERLENLSKKMFDLHELSQEPIEPESYITISDATNSNLYSSGNINIIGNGCINSKVHSGGKLNVFGVVRGGEVYGRLGVRIDEVGSGSGTKTIVSVPSDQKIYIHKAMEGTILKIGNVTRTLNADRKQITGYLNDQNQIILE